MSKTNSERRAEVQNEMRDLMRELDNQSWWLLYHKMPVRAEIPYNQQQAALVQEKYDNALWQLKGAIERYFDLS